MTDRLRLPRGMTAEKLRSIVAYMELFDVMLDKIEFHQGDQKIDVAAVLKGKEVQSDLTAWAEEIEQEQSEDGVRQEGRIWFAYVGGVEVAAGPDRALVTAAFEHHRHTDPAELRRQAEENVRWQTGGGSG